MSLSCSECPCQYVMVTMGLIKLDSPVAVVHAVFTPSAAAAWEVHVDNHVFICV